jgi:hypothetical protein
MTATETLDSLRKVASWSRKTGDISAPAICRQTGQPLVLQDQQLEHLAQQGLLELSALSGIVKCYYLTPKAYNLLEENRAYRIPRSTIIEV